MNAKMTTEMRRKRFIEKVSEAINSMEMTHNELAEHLGYANQNIISMFKQGKTRVPMNKVAQMARVLGANPTEWLRDWMDSYMPGCLEDIEAHICEHDSIERAWLSGLRDGLGGRLPAFDKRVIPPIKSTLAQRAA